jgi:uncharacterized protein (DUF2235 family)
MTAITSEADPGDGAKGAGDPAPGRKGKNVVLCSDGTGNRGGKARGTNVWAIVNAVWRQPDATGKLPSKTQITFYDDGVGSQDFIAFKILGGAFGWGYSRNIRDLYKALVSAYEPGDSIYLFGFSRGAYTVRGLAGLILKQGILNRHAFTSSKELDYAVWAVFRAYRDSYPSITARLRRWLLPGYAKAYQDCKDQGKIHHLDENKEPQTPIRFIGVWDTVDAVGLPFDILSDALNWIVRFRFTDRKLHPNVAKACHAVSVDDERRTFWPVMWDERSDPDAARIKQVWFPGVHSNVGGGYEKDQMALVSLDWMMEEAGHEGLLFYDDVRHRIREDANAHGRMYDSRAGLAAYYRYAPRNIKAISDDAKVPAGKPKVHFSALRRAARATGGYAPIRFVDDIEVVGTYPDADAGLVRKLAATYRAAASGRAAHAKVIDGLIKARTALYWLFLAYSLGILLAAALFYWYVPPPAAPAAAPPELVRWLFDGMTWVLPDYAFGFFKPLLQQAKAHWVIALAALALLLCLVILKWVLARKTRHEALDAWRDFRERAHN